MATLRNRLLLLHYFSSIFCPSVPMMAMIDSRLSSFVASALPEGAAAPLSSSASSANPAGAGLQDWCPSTADARANLSDRLRGLLVTSAKESLLKKVISSTMLRNRQHGPVVELQRIDSGAGCSVPLPLATATASSSSATPAKTSQLRSVFAQMCEKLDVIAGQKADNLMLPHRVWKVKFVGEGADDCGGGYSESIAEMCDELQMLENSALPVPVLIATPNSRTDDGANRDAFLLNPDCTERKYLFMLGLLIGIAVRTGSPLSLNLAEPLWKQLAGIKLTVADLNDFDKNVLPGLLCIRNMSPEDLLAADMPFSYPSAGGHEVSLKPRSAQTEADGFMEQTADSATGYSRVTPANRNEFIDLVLLFRLTEFDRQVQWVREGMSRVVPVPLLNLFTGFELETMVCGAPQVSVSLLKSIATYKGIEPTAPLISWLWEVLEEFTDQERSLFLRFVWGRTRLPRFLADFRGRDFVVQVMDKYRPPDNYLPESYTCFFLVKIPRYSSKQVLFDKLKYAIYFCKSIDTDDYARVAINEFARGEPRRRRLDSFSSTHSRSASEYDSDLERNIVSQSLALSAPTTSQAQSTGRTSAGQAGTTGHGSNAPNASNAGAGDLSEPMLQLAGSLRSVRQIMESIALV